MAPEENVENTIARSEKMKKSDGDDRRRGGFKGRRRETRNQVVAARMKRERENTTDRWTEKR
jgi:hypothetical protein